MTTIYHIKLEITFLLFARSNPIQSNPDKFSFSFVSNNDINLS